MFSDLDDEIQLSQVGNMEFNQSQSASYALDVIDDDNGSASIVYLENFVPTFYVGFKVFMMQNTQKQRVLYNDVVIEGISSDENLDSL